MRSSKYITSCFVLASRAEPRRGRVGKIVGIARAVRRRAEGSGRWRGVILGGQHLEISGISETRDGRTQCPSRGETEVGGDLG